ncbi:MAG: pyridoxamine 5'-phosphate oxidase family protein [Rhodobacteraceae bacterium]|nr:MAG: pyridoxamine 5'-phosphate oxidase family protein [Paracoccaceae bacterium]
MQPRYTRVRHAKRAHYDQEAIHAVLDAGLVAHVGFMAEGRPMVMPMVYGRIGDVVYLHGSSKTRVMTLAEGAALCLAVTLVDALVLARSGFNHSMNYRSVVLHGRGRCVTDASESLAALTAITDHALPGRTAELRAATAQEIKATGVIALEVEAASAKSRSGPPGDDAEDIAAGGWAGLLPLAMVAGAPVPDIHCATENAHPASLAAARRRLAT